MTTVGSNGTEAYLPHLLEEAARESGPDTNALAEREAAVGARGLTVRLRVSEAGEVGSTPARTSISPRGSIYRTA